MSDIKFRVWDKEQGHMYSVTEWKSYAVEVDGNINEDGDNMLFENYILMQYTGLKDKNDVEIYTGDIIERNGVRQKIQDLTPVDRFYGSYPSPVEDDWMSWSEEYKIIGNIYQNPELLEV